MQASIGYLCVRFRETQSTALREIGKCCITASTSPRPTRVMTEDALEYKRLVHKRQSFGFCHDIRKTKLSMPTRFIY
jgi:hypothetical protein